MNLELVTRIQKALSSMTFKKRLMFSYVLVVIVPITIVGFFFVNATRNVILEQAIDEAKNDMESIKRNVLENLRVFVDVSDKIYLDRDVESIATRQFASPFEIRTAYMGFALFDDFMHLHDEIESIRFYAYNETLMENMQFMQVTESVKELEWFTRAISKRGAISWQYANNELMSENFLNLSRQVRTLYGIPIGVLVMDVSKNFLYNEFRFYPYSLKLVDEEGNIIAANDIKLFDANIYAKGFDIGILRSSNGTYNTKYEGKRSLIIVRNFNFPRSNEVFRLFSIIPIDYVFEEVNNQTFVTVLIILGSLMVAFTLLNIFSHQLSKRISLLSSEIHKVANDESDMNITVTGLDEIALVARDINMLIQSKKMLTYNAHQAEIQKNELLLSQKEIRFKMLASQINPHFLFNTLETIRMKAHCCGQAEIAEKVKILGKIMRYNLEVSKDMVTIGQEIELVRNYLEIQRFRYGQKLNYKLDIDSNINQKRILPLIVQPIVENAVIHGLENKAEEGLITVVAREEGDMIKITIDDDGVGMNEDKVYHLSMALNDEMINRNIGLKNVHQRIKIFYGDKYGLTIKSYLNMGTKVEIALPNIGGLNVQSIDN